MCLARNMARKSILCIFPWSKATGPPGLSRGRLKLRAANTHSSIQLSSPVVHDDGVLIQSVEHADLEVHVLSLDPDRNILRIRHRTKRNLQAMPVVPIGHFTQSFPIPSMTAFGMKEQTEVKAGILTSVESVSPKLTTKSESATPGTVGFHWISSFTVEKGPISPSLH